MKINDVNNTPNKKQAKPNKLSKSNTADDREYVDLAYIGDKLVEFVYKTTGHKLKASDFKCLYLSDNADAICFCIKQFNFYNKRKQAGLTPLYFYNGQLQTVVKMKNTLSNPDSAAEALNEKCGLNLQPIKDLIVY